MHITVVRSGGFAGVSRKAQLTVAALSPDDLATVEMMVQQALAMRPRESAPEHADGFQYDLTVRIGRKNHRWTATDAAAASPVVQLAQFVLAKEC